MLQSLVVAPSERSEAMRPPGWLLLAGGWALSKVSGAGQGGLLVSRRALAEARLLDREDTFHNKLSQHPE